MLWGVTFISRFRKIVVHVHVVPLESENVYDCSVSTFFTSATINSCSQMHQSRYRTKARFLLSHAVLAASDSRGDDVSSFTRVCISIAPILKNVRICWRILSSL